MLGRQIEQGFICGVPLNFDKLRHPCTWYTDGLGTHVFACNIPINHADNIFVRGRM